MIAVAAGYKAKFDLSMYINFMPGPYGRIHSLALLPTPLALLYAIFTGNRTLGWENAARITFGVLGLVCVIILISKL